MLKLGYLFTLITTITNITGITNFSWLIVLAPTIAPLILIIVGVVIVNILYRK